MTEPQLTTLAARTGTAVRLAKDESLKIVNTHGTQVVDCWAFNADDLDEWMSMPHTRNAKIIATLQVEHRADRPPGLAFQVADDPQALAVVLLAAMAEIKPEDIGARVEQGMDRGRVRGARPQGRDDFGVAAASHGRPAYPCFRRGTG